MRTSPWKPATFNASLGIMDTINTAPNDPADSPSEENETDRQQRLVWEAEGLARARASVAAGYYATSAEVNAWIDSLGTDHPLPVPYPQQPRPR